MAYLEELLPAFRNGEKIRVLGWDDGKYYYFKNGIIYNQNNKEIKGLSLSLLFSDCGELYEEPIDWDYIIKSSCLCWFWDGWVGYGYIGILDAIYENCDLKFFMRDKNGNQSQFRNCRPLRRDEVTFYEDSCRKKFE